MNTRVHLTRNKGFTLMEILAVVAIISIFLAIMLPTLSIARGRGRDATRISQMKEIANALELYHLDHKEYPIDGCTILGKALGCGCDSFTEMVEEELIPGGYISKVPDDPTHPNPCYQYQRNYIGSACGGKSLPQENYVVLFRSETSLANSFRKWVEGESPGAYSCLTSAQ